MPHIRCPDCDAQKVSVFENIGTGDCARCHGTGRLNPSADWLGAIADTASRGHESKCDVCHGSRKCRRCRGTGEIWDSSQNTERTSSHWERRPREPKHRRERFRSSTGRRSRGGGYGSYYPISGGGSTNITDADLSIPIILGAISIVVIVVAVWGLVSWSRNYKPKPYTPQFLPSITRGSSGTTFTLGSDNPQAVQAFNDGAYFLKARQFSQAVASLNQAIRLKPDYADAYVLRGNAFRELGHNDQALQDYDRGIALKPKDTFAYRHRALAYTRLGQQDHAIVDFSKAIELNPSDADLWNGRADVYFSLDKYELALRDWSKALELTPNDANLFINRGSTYANLGRRNEGVENYTHAIRLVPNDARAYFLLCRTYKDLGRLQEAHDTYQRGLAYLRPDDQLGRQWAEEARVYLGSIANVAP